MYVLSRRLNENPIVFPAPGVRFDVAPGREQTSTSQVLSSSGQLEGQMVVNVPSLSSETLMEVSAVRWLQGKTKPNLNFNLWSFVPDYPRLKTLVTDRGGALLLTSELTPFHNRLRGWDFSVVSGSYLCSEGFSSSTFLPGYQAPALTWP